MNKVVQIRRPLDIVYEKADAQFFADHPDRQARIRRAYDDECNGEFWSLGPHDRNRRRIVLWRVPADNPYFDPLKPQLLKIPFIAYADETIEDRDDVLLPIIHDIMRNART